MAGELLLVLEQGLAVRRARDTQLNLAVRTGDLDRHPAGSEVDLRLVDNHRQLAAHQGIEIDLAVLGLAIDDTGDPATVVVLARLSVEQYLARLAHADGAKVLAHVLAIVPVQHDLDAFDILQGGDFQLGLLAHPDLGDHADLNGVGLCSKGEAAQQQEKHRNQE